MRPSAPPRPYVLGVGGLAPRKGFDLLIDALAAAGVDLDLVLAGDGPERAALATRAAAHGLGARVHFEGHVERTALASLVRGGRGGRDPLALRGLLARLARAMQAGAPIVASALPVFPPELRDGETGLLVPVGDVAALAGALRTLATDPERARALGTAARAAARAFPTWDEVTAHVLAEYASVVG